MSECPCSSVSASLLCRSTNFFTATIFRRPPKSKKVGQLPSLRQFQFFDPTGYPAPNRVTFLAGVNRDFPNWRRHFI